MDSFFSWLYISSSCQLLFFYTDMLDTFLDSRFCCHSIVTGMWGVFCFKKLLSYWLITLNMWTLGFYSLGGWVYPLVKEKNYLIQK